MHQGFTPQGELQDNFRRFWSVSSLDAKLGRICVECTPRWGACKAALRSSTPPVHPAARRPGRAHPWAPIVMRTLVFGRNR